MLIKNAKKNKNTQNAISLAVSNFRNKKKSTTKQQKIKFGISEKK
tara:strand:+ start:44 stop:178 length:135 start_codon:yes stop_codon:yes gene_type:complete